MEGPEQAGITGQQEPFEIQWGQISCLCEGGSPCTHAGWRLPVWVAALLKKPWAVLMGGKLIMNQQYAIAIEKENSLSDCIDKSIASN